MILKIILLQVLEKSLQTSCQYQRSKIFLRSHIFRHAHNRILAKIESRTWQVTHQIITRLDKILSENKNPFKDLPTCLEQASWGISNSGLGPVSAAKFKGHLQYKLLAYKKTTNMYNFLHNCSLSGLSRDLAMS